MVLYSRPPYPTRCIDCKGRRGRHSYVFGGVRGSRSGMRILKFAQSCDEVYGDLSEIAYRLGKQACGLDFRTASAQKTSCRGLRGRRRFHRPVAVPPAVVVVVSTSRSMVSSATAPSCSTIAVLCIMLCTAADPRWPRREAPSHRGGLARCRHSMREANEL